MDFFNQGTNTSRICNFLFITPCATNVKCKLERQVDQELIKQCMPCSSPPNDWAHNGFDYSDFEVLIIECLF